MLYLTEGELKGLKLTQEGFPTIALAGVWSWKTKEHGQSLPISDLERVQWKGRKVVIVFDSDLGDKPPVAWAEHALVIELPWAAPASCPRRAREVPAHPAHQARAPDARADQFLALTDGAAPALVVCLRVPDAGEGRLPRTAPAGVSPAPSTCHRGVDQDSSSARDRPAGPDADGASGWRRLEDRICGLTKRRECSELAPLVLLDRTCSTKGTKLDAHGRHHG